MDPQVYALMHGEPMGALTGKTAGKPRANQKKPELPKEMRLQLDKILDSLLEMEKGEYHDDLVPFEQHVARIKEDAAKNALNFYTTMQQAQSLLKEAFELEEKQNPAIEKEAHFSAWEKASAGLREKMQDPEYSPMKEHGMKPLQEVMEISWGFMDRAYHVALKQLGEKKYEDAGHIFLFLRSLNDAVFEYWFGEATCLQARKQWKEAIDIYFMSLLFQPQSALVFFQLSNCYYQFQDLDSCLKTLDISIEYAEKDPEQASLLQQAKAAKERLKTS